MNYYNYFTEIEEHFVRRRGKSLLVSPMDWSLITTWRDSGVPLHVVLRGIDIAMDKFFSGKRRASERPGTLFYCHDAVMAEYAGYLEAHLGEAKSDQVDAAAALGAQPNPETAEEEGPGKEKVVEFISARILEIKEVRAKHSLVNSALEELDRVLLRLDELTSSLNSTGRIDLEAAERDLEILDDLLLRALKTELPQEQLADWEQEAKKELKIYKKRLPKATYEKIRDNFIRGKIHRKYNVGELSLFHL